MSPNTVGSNAASAVQPHEPLSFLMVNSVVEQGQCIRQKIKTHSTRLVSHPADSRIARRPSSLASPSVPAPV